jgi:hypothetical protein
MDVSLHVRMHDSTVHNPRLTRVPWYEGSVTPSRTYFANYVLNAVPEGLA